MKKTLFILLTLTTVFDNVSSQITTSVVRANFGIEADLSSNFFNNAAQPAVDDWFSQGYPGTGQGIIDTTGAAAIVAAYIANPATRSLSFFKLMKQAPYSIVNNKMLLDGIFHRDFHGNDSTVFASGSNKNGMSPNSWNCPLSQSIPDKNDILDAFTHVRRAGPNLTDSLWMFAGISIENTTGSRYFDFELYQTDIAYNRSTNKFVNYGPDFGHTTWKFDASGNVIAPGDICFTAEFGSSSVTNIEARIWINKTDLSVIPASFSWGGSFDGDGNSATYGYASIEPKTAGDFYTGILNASTNSWAGPFYIVRDNNSVLSSYIAKQFMEIAVNLSKLGIEPASFGNPCGNPFRRVLIKTRASTSFTAELKDFIAPFRLFDFPAVNADAFIKYYCETMPTTAISILNPLSTSSYTWSTTNGSIVGPNTGTSISVNAPGTYYVNQQLHTSCPAFAQDSVTLFFDSVCSILDVNIHNFKVLRTNEQTGMLSWTVSNNELIAQLEIEYSTDNINFQQLTSIEKKRLYGSVTYQYAHNIVSLQNETIYYRLKLTGSNNAKKLSTVILSRSEQETNNVFRFFPNPTNGKGWISINHTESSEANIVLYDIYGRMINRLQVKIKKGKNIIALDRIENLQPGIYMIHIKMGSLEQTEKVIINP